MTQETLFGMTLDRLREITSEMGMPRFAASQIASWLYKKGVTEIGQMTDLSLRNRTRLEEHYRMGLTPPLAVSISRDGTKKYLFETGQGHRIESAYIPDRERATLCVSSQAGCKMGCAFCATGRQGFQQHLTTGEILNQIASLPERETLTNVVYMGMGEPLDNLDNVLDSLEILTAPWGYAWSPTRITLSTVGVTPALKTFLDRTKAHLAVSLHNPFPDQRAAIMPLQRVHPVAEVIELLKRYDWNGQRRVSFEYIVLRGMNDSPAHIRELCRLLDGLKCRINLIRFHAIPGSPFVSPGPEEMIRFRDELSRRGITTTIRASRGEDIQAACGLLSTRHPKKTARTPVPDSGTTVAGNNTDKH